MNLPGQLSGERSEQRVRALVGDFNDRVRLAHLGGPPLTVRTLDVDQVVTEWHRDREQHAAPPSQQRRTDDKRRRPWWRRH